MQKYDAIENGIAKNDVKALREAIGSICYTNRNFSNGEFFEVVKYVESKGIQLKDKELMGNPTISSQKSEFTDEDFARAIFELKRNFCDERIQDVKMIGEKLYGKEIAVVKPIAEQRNDAGINPNVKSRQQYSSTFLMLIGLAAVVVILIFVLLAVK